ncbi:response regulator, partial [Klebsiella pneumoniae]|nr:response regulator [Klebsiella pneumoniae]
LRRLLLELLQPRRTRGEPAPSTRGQRQPKILCVDDNAANLLLVQTLLEDLGADVLALDNGHAAVQAVQSEHFDLVLMDVQMPGMDGRACTEQIRLWENTQSGSPLP